MKDRLKSTKEQGIHLTVNHLVL